MFAGCLHWSTRNPLTPWQATKGADNPVVGSEAYMYVRITNVSGRTAQEVQLRKLPTANIFRGVVFGAGLGPAPPPEAAVATVLPAPQL